MDLLFLVVSWGVCIGTTSSSSLLLGYARDTVFKEMKFRFKRLDLSKNTLGEFV